MIMSVVYSGSYSAAECCVECKDGGYGDWYLPSKYELNLLYVNKDVVGNFQDEFYWSSTDYSDAYAWAKDFVYPGESAYVSKANWYWVRSIRAF
jgi:chondroitin AC lyase